MMDKETLKLALMASAVCTALVVILAVRAILQARSEAAERKERMREAVEEADAFAGEQQGVGRFGALADVMRPKTIEELSEQRRELSRAGMRDVESVSLYALIRVIALFAAVGIFFALLVSQILGAFSIMFGALILGAGFLGPRLWLRAMTSNRQAALQRSLPPTLDLLVTCMEAGLGLEQALARVAGEIDFSDPEMAEELAVVVGEIRAGLTVGAAFKKLADRVTSDEVRNLSNVIVQSATLGASLGRTLREYASSARRKRELGLEEEAGRVTAGLTLPLTLCLLPSAVIAMLGPAVVIVVNTIFE